MRTNLPALTSKTPDDRRSARLESPSPSPGRYPIFCGSRRERESLLIVGLGSSAGGLEAMEEFFRHMPSDSGLAFIVVSHQQAGQVNLLPSLLAPCTSMPVREATNGLAAQPNHVYLAPGGMTLALVQGVLHVLEQNPKDRLSLPIDYFFRSLADDQKHRAVGIILSGMLTDGTLGLRAIKAEGGLTIAQDPLSAAYPGMPQSAIEAEVVDVVQRPAKMPQALLGHANRRLTPMTLPPHKDASDALKKLFMLLRKRTGNDFTVYKSSSLHRRVEQRMLLHHITDWTQYLRFVQANPGELDALFQELLIGVTTFFRDPSSFEALAQTALPALVEGKPDDSTLRVWVAGCSTGEEAYSLAMLLTELLARCKRRIALQIFASDLDDRALRTARSGVYPLGIAVDLPASRLERFFTLEGNQYRLKNEIRNTVVFARHNLLRDAPFTKLDLVSCRNVLIYLEGPAQHKLVSLFHYVLNPEGILFLGSSESVGESESLFTVIHRTAKIFQRLPQKASLPEMDRDSLKRRRTRKGTEQTDVPMVSPRAPSVSDLIQRVLARRYAPASVIVNGQGQIMLAHGDMRAYLEPSQGLPARRILDVARPGLRREVAAALRQAAGTDHEVVRRSVPARGEQDKSPVTVTAVKLTEPEALVGWFLLTFQPLNPATASAANGRRPRRGRPQQQGHSGMVEERAPARRRLQQSLDELQAVHEDTKSFNEALQTTNEELETTKEEMQSLNEELVTINSELQDKVQELGEANDDLRNLMNSTEVATIFLDRDLRVKRFTTEARQVSHLIALDVGRPLSDIVSKLNYDGMLEDALLVLRTLTPQEHEVQAANGAWFLVRIFPYRTSHDTVDGLVLTFLDISRYKDAEGAMSASRGLAGGIMDTVRAPVLILDEHLRVTAANPVFYDTFHLIPREVEQQSIYRLSNDSWDSSELRALLGEVLPGRCSFRNFVVDRIFPRIGRKRFSVNGVRLAQGEAQAGRIVLALDELNAAPDGEPLGASGESVGKAGSPC